MPLHPLTKEQQSLLDEYKQSGLSIYDFAAQKRLSYSSVHYVIDKDRRIRSENIPADFVSVPLQGETTRNTTINVNNLISFNLNGLFISIDKTNLKYFLEALANDWFRKDWWNIPLYW